MNWSEVFSQGLSYDDFLARYATPQQLAKWTTSLERTRLTDEQLARLAMYKRQMPVIVLAGAWCGDCIDQVPLFARISQAAPVVDIRYFDRDAHAEIASQLRICGGARVPSVLFLSEDFQEVGRYGDRTLAKYRSLMQQMAGESCSTGLVFNVELAAQVSQEWLDQFERAQLILRTSPRLRQKHGD